MRANILVLDDNLDNLRLLMDVLTEQGYKVRPTAEVDFALKSAVATPPDLILLDVMMPEMDGFEVCKRLKANPQSREIPVIFLSALNDVKDKMTGFDVGGADYITKPFQSQEVLARVNIHLTIGQQKKTLQKKNDQLQQEISRRQEAEEQLTRMNQELQEINTQLRQANASKDKFFSIIAHDLRSPFTSLINITETLSDHFDYYNEKTRKEHIQHLHKTSKQTFALLNNLLAWSRLERDLMSYEPTSFSLLGIIEKNVRLLHAQTRMKHITLGNQLSYDIEIFADFSMVDTIFRNLMTNAVKFTPAGGAIDVSILNRDRHFIEIAVSDTGIGMSADYLDTLFQIDIKTTRPGTSGEKGSGLGLVLCKELIKKNGGALRIESEQGKGSRFIVRLPAAPEMTDRSMKNKAFCDS